MNHGISLQPPCAPDAPDFDAPAARHCPPGDSQCRQGREFLDETREPIDVHAIRLLLLGLAAFWTGVAVALAATAAAISGAP